MPWKVSFVFLWDTYRGPGLPTGRVLEEKRKTSLNRDSSRKKRFLTDTRCSERNRILSEMKKGRYEFVVFFSEVCGWCGGRERCLECASMRPGKVWCFLKRFSLNISYIYLLIKFFIINDQIFIFLIIMFRFDHLIINGQIFVGIL